jgi:carbon monoxide dehydrogenase subunit G
MKLEHVVTVSASPDAVWDLLMDVPRVAACVPGAGAVENIGPDRWAGTVQVRVGPIALALAGRLEVTERDAESRVAAMRVDGADPRIGGAVTASMTMSLVAESEEPPVTRLQIATDAKIMGRLGDLGQPIIKRKADDLMRDFAQNVAAALATSPGSTG